MKDRAIVALWGTRRIPINATVRSITSGWLPSPDRDPIWTRMRYMECQGHRHDRPLWHADIPHHRSRRHLRFNHEDVHGFEHSGTGFHGHFG